MSTPKGFTIAELLISIAIMMILTTMVIANFSRGRLSDDLRVSSQNLAENLRTVQNLATVGQAIAINGNTRVPPGGYGIAIPWAQKERQYMPFADIAKMDSGNCVTTDAGTANVEFDGPSCDQLVGAGTVTLQPDVVFSAIKVNDTETDFGNGTWGNDLLYVNFDFRPPQPIPVIDGVNGQTVQIELEHTKTGDFRTITIIGPSGQISERAGKIQ